MRPEERLKPASTIVDLLGGPTAAAELLGVHRTRVSNWMRPKSRGGSGGNIPPAHHRAILAVAAERHLAITAEDLLPNNDVRRPSRKDNAA